MKPLLDFHSRVAAQKKMESSGFEPLRDSQSLNDPTTAFGIEPLKCSHSQNLAGCEEELKEKSALEVRILETTMCAGGMKPLLDFHSQVAAQEKMESSGFEPLRDSQSQNDPTTAFGIEPLMCSHSQNLGGCEEKLTKKSALVLNLQASKAIQKIQLLMMRKID